jgi:glycosyltransferase involved in cell wall biosynthesis
MTSAAVVLLVQDPDRVERELPALLPGRTIRSLRREDLVLPPWALMRRLVGLGADELILLTDDLDRHERLWRLQALGAMPLAPRRYILDRQGRRLGLGALRFVFRDMPAALGGVAASGLVLLRTRWRLARLLAAPRHRPAPARGHRVAYLRSDLWTGVPAGGSVAHTAGVAEGFVRGGADLYFVSTGRPGLIDEARTPVHRVPPSRLYNLFREVPYFAHALRFERRAGQVLSAAPPDLIYQRFDPSSVAGVGLARRRGVPLVLEYNGSEVWIADHWDRPFRWRTLFADTESVNLQHADLIVVVSEVLREGLVARGVEPERILVRANGVDPDRYHPRVDGAAVRRRHGLVGRIVVGFVGTFGMWHGAPVLARAARRVLEARPEARFLFVGDGRDRAESQAALAHAGDRAIFTGMVPQEEGPEHLAAMDILVAPHVPNADGTRFFGSPTKLFEYLAMGRAVVASRLEQIGDVLEDGRTAVLVPPGDEAALARSIVALIDDPARRAALGAAARAVALERHTWAAHVRGITERLQAMGLADWS